MYKFDITSSNPGLILLTNGMVFRKNNAFTEMFTDHDIVGSSIFSYLTRYDGTEIYNNRFNNENML